jgi:hypothetical protein
LRQVDHLTAVAFAALTLAFDVGGIFVSLAAAGLLDFHFGVGVSDTGNGDETEDNN